MKSPKMSVLLRGSITQQIRLVSGLILFAFAATHFLNHSLGLFSIDAMMEAQSWRTAVTRSLPGGIVLGLALIAHIALALYKLVRRQTFRMPPWELVQILLGLSIPFLLFPHIVNTRVAHTFFGVNDIYFYELVKLWPNKGWNQTILLLLVWTHGCVGIHFWLRLTRWYNRLFPVLFALAVLVPVTAISGFMVAGRYANIAITDPAIFENLKAVSNWPNAADGKSIATYGTQAKYAFYILLGAVLLMFVGRLIASGQRPKIAVNYSPEPTVSGVSGATLLEISRMNNVPHLSVCGGRARCSTCRVHVISGGEYLHPPSRAEAATLKSIDAGPDVRLACQLRPYAEVTVNLLLSPASTETQANSMDVNGTERDLAILFLDLRGFTTLSDGRLPYDVVFLLNRLFDTVGTVIHEEGGWIDKYLGDGLMAVFGRDSDPETACLQAIRAAHRIDLAMDGLNRTLKKEVTQPLRIGMGLHVGPLVLGEIGHPSTASMTVIGSTVNVAARLEASTKELECQMVISLEAAKRADLDISELETKRLTVRGVKKPLEVLRVEQARQLPVELLPEVRFEPMSDAK
jgi:adenylate cyclase